MARRRRAPKRSPAVRRRTAPAKAEPKRAGETGPEAREAEPTPPAQLEASDSTAPDGGGVRPAAPAETPAEDATPSTEPKPPVSEGEAVQAGELASQPPAPPEPPPPAAQQPAPTQPPAPAVIRAEGLRKVYRGRAVVKGVSIEVRQGEVVGLLGPNGAGKTTTFYMVVGLTPPDDGEIFLDSDEISDLPMYLRAQRGISYLPQEPSVFRKMTVENNLRAVFETQSLSRSEMNRRIDQLISELDLERIRRNYGHSLSGGERRRVEIARALAIDPRFVLLDEPFAGIDPKAVGGIQDIVRHLRNMGIGILITDHNVRETLSITDRAYIINNGEILRAGPPGELSADPQVRKIYLGEDFRL